MNKILNEKLIYIKLLIFRRLVLNCYIHYDYKVFKNVNYVGIK